jgi:hypothetical protein
MKKILIFGALFILTSCVGTKSKESVCKTNINSTLNAWHKAASEAKFDEYFSLMTDTGVFIGTDATENWQNQAFRTFSKPYFDNGKAWTYIPLERNVYLNKSQNTAWFDELLSSQLKICRGSGVLIREKGKWKIAHYVLSMTVPNEKAMDVVKIKAAIEDSIIKRKRLE